LRCPIDTIDPITIYFYLFWLNLSKILLFIVGSADQGPTKDDVLGLLADLGQPSDILVLMGFLPCESFDGFIASLSRN
jgi:hypothetical protein